MVWGSGPRSPSPIRSRDGLATRRATHTSAEVIAVHEHATGCRLSLRVKDGSGDPEGSGSVGCGAKFSGMTTIARLGLRKFETPRLHDAVGCVQSTIWPVGSRQRFTAIVNVKLPVASLPSFRASSRSHSVRLRP